MDIYRVNDGHAAIQIIADEADRMVNDDILMVCATLYHDRIPYACMVDPGLYRRISLSGAHRNSGGIYAWYEHYKKQYCTQ